jgi:hypothetical protein
MHDQICLWQEPRIDASVKRKLSNRERFELFHRANPHVYDAIVQIARDLKQRGFKSCGMKLIFERLRWLTAIETRGDGFKLNNVYTAFYARFVMSREVDLKGFFRVREAEADEKER